MNSELWFLGSEALMQHFQAAEFSEEVSIIATPLVEPLKTARMMMTGGFASLAHPQNKELICLVPQLPKWPINCIHSLGLMSLVSDISRTGKRA